MNPRDEFEFNSLAGVQSRTLVRNHIVNTVDGKTTVGGGYAVTMPKGKVTPEFMRIEWQDGGVNRETGENLNGAQVEDVLEVASRRLEAFEETDFAHPSNASAIQHIQDAIEELGERRDDRRKRGVEGKDEL